MIYDGFVVYKSSAMSEHAVLLRIDCMNEPVSYALNEYFRRKDAVCRSNTIV